MTDTDELLAAHWRLMSAHMMVDRGFRDLVFEMTLRLQYARDDGCNTLAAITGYATYLAEKVHRELAEALPRDGVEMSPRSVFDLSGAAMAGAVKLFRSLPPRGTTTLQ
jgi:hypothetical protein